MSRARLLAIAGLLVAAAAIITARGLLRQRPAPIGQVAVPPVAAASHAKPPAAAPAPSSDHRFGVAALEGVAQHEQGGSRRRLAVGDVVERSAWIETGRGSSLRLEDAGGASVQINSSTRVRFDEMDQQATRLTLDRGRVRATSPKGRSIGLRAAKGGAAVESVGGDFSMQAEPGAVRIVPHRNKVTLIARDERLEVQEGEGVVVASGRGPVKSLVPHSLLLKVRWPEGLVQRQRSVEVAGQTAPGALVRSGASEVLADAHGRFSIAVPLHEGENLPRLSSEDVAGRRVASTGSPVRIDSRRPEIAAEAVRYGR